MSISVYGWGSGYITTAGFGGYYEAVIDLIPWIIAEYLLEIREAVSTRDRGIIALREADSIGTRERGLVASRDKLLTIPTRERDSVSVRERN